MGLDIYIKVEDGSRGVVDENAQKHRVLSAGAAQRDRGSFPRKSEVTLTRISLHAERQTSGEKERSQRTETTHSRNTLRQCHCHTQNEATIAQRAFKRSKNEYTRTLPQSLILAAKLAYISRVACLHTSQTPPPNTNAT